MAYEYQEYPKILYKGETSICVGSAAAEKAAKEKGFSDSIHPEPAQPTIPVPITSPPKSKRWGR